MRAAARPLRKLDRVESTADVVVVRRVEQRVVDCTHTTRGSVRPGECVWGLSSSGSVPVSDLPGIRVRQRLCVRPARKVWRGAEIIFVDAGIAQKSTSPGCASHTVDGSSVPTTPKVASDQVGSAEIRCSSSG